MKNLSPLNKNSLAFLPTNMRILFLGLFKSTQRKFSEFEYRNVSFLNNISMLSAEFCVNPKAFLLSKYKVVYEFSYDGVSATEVEFVCEFQSSLFEIFYEQGQIRLPELFFCTSPFFFLISISRTLRIQVWWILVKTSNCLVVFTILFYLSFIHAQLIRSSFSKYQRIW